MGLSVCLHASLSLTLSRPVIEVPIPVCTAIIILDKQATNCFVVKSSSVDTANVVGALIFV